MPGSSPFPGLDPYLEHHWGDIHTRVISYMCDAIAEQLPGGLVARMGERVYLESGEPLAGIYVPDVRVVEYPGRVGTLEGAPPQELRAGESIRIRLMHEPITEAYIEVQDVKSGHRVVTAIELLSPENKRRGRGRQLFNRKQRQMRRAKVNTVEIDLLRTGYRAGCVRTAPLPRAWRRTGLIAIWRPGRFDEAEVFPASLREPLPAIPIPLRPGEPEIRLELQPLFDRAYRLGGYDVIDYREDPEPPLDPDDSAWADALLREQGKR